MSIGKSLNATDSSSARLDAEKLETSSRGKSFENEKGYLTQSFFKTIVIKKAKNKILD